MALLAALSHDLAGIRAQLDRLPEPLPVTEPGPRADA